MYYMNVYLIIVPSSEWTVQVLLDPVDPLKCWELLHTKQHSVTSQKKRICRNVNDFVLHGTLVFPEFNMLLITLWLQV